MQLAHLLCPPCRYTSAADEVHYSYTAEGGNLNSTRAWQVHGWLDACGARPASQSPATLCAGYLTCNTHALRRPCAQYVYQNGSGALFTGYAWSLDKFVEYAYKVNDFQ